MNYIKEALRNSCQRILFAACVLFMAVTMIQCSDTLTEPAVQPEVSQPQLAPIVARGGTVHGTLINGSIYLISVPPSWNGDLVVYAHGYVPFNEPLQLPDDELEGISISGTVNSMGYAYATTSYPHNGLVIPEAVEDIYQLRMKFKTEVGEPGHVYLVGASEGALVAALAMEKYGNAFDGAMPVSGPVGDFRKQIDYFGDFRVVFDYFFPDVFIYPGGGKVPFVVLQDEVDHWDWWVTRIQNAVGSNQHAVQQLLRVTHASVDPSNPSTAVQTALDVLRYNVFATKDAELKLGGQPFDNKLRWYSGSDNDILLNWKVKRIQASQVALNKINLLYQTSGDIHRPVVTMHTTLDHVVPYWHEPLYSLKVLLKGSALQHINIPIVRYGHGTFNVGEVVAGFAVLVFRVTLSDLIVAENVIPDAQQRADFLRLAQQNGAHPKITTATVSLNK